MLPVTRILLIDTSLQQAENYFYKTYTFASFQECINWLENEMNVGNLKDWAQINNRYVMLLPNMRSNVYYRLQSISAAKRLLEKEPIPPIS